MYTLFIRIIINNYGHAILHLPMQSPIISDVACSIPANGEM